MAIPLPSTVPLSAIATSIAGAFAISWAGTWMMRRYALARAIMDVPNHRSSHSVPMPRGGGAAIVIAFLVGVVSLVFVGLLPLTFALGVGIGAALIAAVGWVDDRRGVPPLRRALVQLAAASWSVWWLGGLESIELGPRSLQLGGIGTVLAVVVVVWTTNLFNFMDGIDGIAGSQAATSGILGGALLLAGGRPDLAAAAFVVAGASLGFLIWNWSPAKIFMGDVGSSTLGFVFASLAIAGQNSGAVPLMASVALGGVFVLDATATLIRRVARGSKWYEPHRSHAYQRAVRSGWSHRQVSGAIVVINGLVGGALLASREDPAIQLTAALAGLVAAGLLYMLVEARMPMSESGD